MSQKTAQAVRARAEAQAQRASLPVAVIAAALVGYGLVMVYSASIPATGLTVEANSRFLAREMFHLALGLGLVLISLRVPTAAWERAGPYLLLAGVVMLGLVLAGPLGEQVNGSTRWLRAGQFRFQPSEFAKVFVVIYCAGYLARRRDRVHTWTGGILIMGGVVTVFGLLLLMEPDFGSLVVIAGTVFAMTFMAGARLLHVFVCMLFAAASLAALTVVSPYRMQRVTAFLDPWSDPFDSGFQLVQALIAFGRGEWLGVGLGSSIQKLHYLPAANNDFLLAVVGEELGFVGVAAVIALFAAFAWRALAIARLAETTNQVFAARLAAGIGTLFGLQAMINMGVNMAVLPTKGLTLPFMSHGGSSLLASCLALGILLRVESEIQPRPGARR